MFELSLHYSDIETEDLISSLRVLADRVRLETGAECDFLFQDDTWRFDFGYLGNTLFHDSLKECLEEAISIGEGILN